MQLLPAIRYGNPEVPIGISGGVKSADFFYGLLSDASAECEKIQENSGLVVQVYQRFLLTEISLMVLTQW